MPKRGENIYKRKDGRWEGRYIKHYDTEGKAKYGYVYAKTYHEVKIKLREKSNQLQKDEEKCADIVYGDILTEWMQTIRIQVKESTYARYYHLVEKHIKPELGKYPVSQISTALITGYIGRMLSAGRIDGNGGLSPKTVTDTFTILKKTISYARCSGYYVICNLDDIVIKKKIKEMRVLSADEQQALLKVLLSEMDFCKFGVLLCLYTGIRIGELCALRWKYIDVDNKIMRVQETMQRVQYTDDGLTTKTHIIITEPKSTCSIRNIPLPDCIMDYVKLFQNDSEVFVLTGRQDKFIEPRTMQNRFQVYAAESGICHANFHALRHTFATRCIELGFEVKSLSEILGHANVNITLNRYVHSSFELKSSNMNKLKL